MNEKQVEQIIQNYLSNSRFRVDKVPYHNHDNVNSTPVQFSSILNAPNSFCIAINTNGTNNVDIFGIGGAKYNFTITGVFIISLDATAGNIVLKNNGNTVSTIAKGTTAGTMIGATSLSNKIYIKGTPINVSSSSTGNATIFITFNI